MKRAAGWLVTLAAASGCVTTEMDGMTRGNLTAGFNAGGSGPRPPMLAGMVGTYGEPVAAVPPIGPHAPGAYGGVGPEVLQAGMPGFNSPVMPASYIGGMDANVMQAMYPPVPHTGLPPGVPGGSMPQGSVQAFGAMGAMGGGTMGGAMGATGPAAPTSQRTQVRFVGPAGASVGWYVATGAQEAGRPVLMPHQVPLPGRYNFLQASIYRIKLSDIPGRPGLELYPTIEVVPSNAKTDAFLAHNYVPVEFTEEDFDQVTAGNFITKVIYLPDPQFANQAVTGVEELSSTRLDPGVDPIAEAYRRGHILMVVRLGGIDLETRNSPPLDAAGPYCIPQGNMPQGGNRNMAMPRQPTPPGIAQPTPGGMPGMPPMQAPDGPVMSPPSAPNGPMIPAPASSLPTLPPGGVGAKAGTGGVQQTAYLIGPDGQAKPVGIAPAGEPPVFPQTALPLNTPAPAGKKAESKRRGLFDSWFGK